MYKTMYEERKVAVSMSGVPFTKLKIVLWATAEEIAFRYEVLTAW